LKEKFSILVAMMLGILVLNISCNSSRAIEQHRVDDPTGKKPSPNSPEMLTTVAPLTRTRWLAADWHSVWITESAGESWRRVLGPSKQTGLGQFTGGLSFVDNDLGYAVLDNTVWRTSDAGSTWITVSDDHLQTSNIFFQDARIGWGAGSGWTAEEEDATKPLMIGRLWCTRDGGKHWEEQPLPKVYMDTRSDRWFLNDISFSDPMNGWAVGLGEFLHTSDGGQTWKELKVHDRLERIAFANSSLGWAIWKESGEFRLTTDSGKTWRLNDKIVQNVNGQIVFVTDKVGFAIQNSVRFIRTIDGGETWETVLLENGPLSQLETASDLSVYLGRAKDGTLIAIWLLEKTGKVITVSSSDDGKTWQ
jgi:photosystem II stability/assembly factor-like uncharacterized protein